MKMLSKLLKYGAVSGKTHALYGKRLTAADFERLAKTQSVPEIAAFLRASPSWTGALKDFDMTDVHRGQLELRLRWGLSKEYIRLWSFASGEQKELLRALMFRAEVNEILRFMRYLTAGHVGDYTPVFPKGYVRGSKIDYGSLARISGYDAFLEAVAGSPLFELLRNALPQRGRTVDYNLMEMLLWKHYYTRLWDAAKKIRGDDRDTLFELIGTQVDFRNIINVIRLKTSFPIEKEEMARFIVPISRRLRPKHINSLIDAPDAEAAMDLLREGPYRSAFLRGDYKNIEDYYYAEIYNICVRYLHNGMPSIYIPMVYLILKEIELKNLITVVECVRYNVPAGQIPAFIVGMTKEF